MTASRVRGRRPWARRGVFARALREERRGLIGWSVGIATYCVVMLSIFPTIHDNRAFAKIFEAYPEVFRRLFNVTDFTTGPGYLGAEIFSVVAPMLLTLFAILWGSDLAAGEEDRGTIDLLLANPVSRRRVVLEKWSALAVGTLGLGAVLEATLGLLGPLFSLSVGWAGLSAAVIGSAAFALAFATLALAVGASSGSRGLARGVATALAVASYLLSALAPLVSALQRVVGLSLWDQALGHQPLTTGLRLGSLGVVMVVVIVLVAVSVWGYDRRDLAT